MSVDQLHCVSCRELLTNVLDMVSVLISVVSNTESTHGQSAEDSRKAAFTLFKKLKVCACSGSKSDLISKNKTNKRFEYLVKYF